MEIINDSAFRDTGITAFIVPNTTHTIEYAAFQESNMATISFQEPSQVQTIGQQAFSETSLTTFAVPNTVHTI